MHSIERQLLEDAVEREFDAGEPLPCEGPILGVVVEGLIRVYIHHLGREVTIYYLGPSDVLGLPMTVAPHALLTSHVKPRICAVTRSRLLQLSPQRFASLVSLDGRLAWWVCEALVHDLAVVQELLSENIFLSIRQRVARHLLDLAVREDGVFLVHATQRELADAIGTVREVISRALVQLRDEGLIRRTPNGLLIEDIAALHAASAG